jgi:hypothetical protein
LTFAAADAKNDTSNERIEVLHNKEISKQTCTVIDTIIVLYLQDGFVMDAHGDYNANSIHMPCRMRDFNGTL